MINNIEYRIQEHIAETWNAKILTERLEYQYI